MYVPRNLGYLFLFLVYIDEFGNFQALILLVVVYVFLGVPLTAPLCKMFKGSRCGYSRPLSTSSSIHHTSTRRGYSMSPRRLGSEETLLDGLVDVGNDKVDGSLSFLSSQTYGEGSSMYHSRCAST